MPTGLPEGPAWVVALSLLLAAGVAVVKVVANLKARRSEESGPVQYAVLQALAAVRERIAQLPTREDLIKIAEQNRHDTRATLMAVQATLQKEIADVEQSLRRDP